MSGPVLAVVTGLDGTGKTTLVEHVTARLCAERGPNAARAVRIWDALADLVPKERMQHYLGQVGDRSRATLLLHALTRSLELGHASGARVLLFEGYWYKYAVTELAHGTPGLLFQMCEALFPRPDITWCLDLPVGVAVGRKQGITQYERGLSAIEGSDREAFVAFQERLRAPWADLERRVGPWRHLSSEAPVEALGEVVIRELPVAW